MFYLAEHYGVHCTGLTLSTAQVQYVESQIAQRNLADRVQVKYQNIHDMQGQWDYIVSVGVLEHIADYDDLYRKTALALKDGGRALFHTMYHDHWFHKTDAFLAKYIFPGGTIPGVKRNQKIFRKYFKYVDRNDLPELSYPKTLACWFKNFCQHEEEIRQLLRDRSQCPDAERAIRIFKHYLTLAYCGLTNEAIVSNTLVYN
jgi:cyclopropane-fatty-acyl-phospholipid synthase